MLFWVFHYKYDMYIVHMSVSFLQSVMQIAIDCSHWSKCEIQSRMVQIWLATHAFFLSIPFAFIL